MKKTQVTFSGRISAMIKKWTDRIPQLAINMTNEKLANGIQVKASRLYPKVFRYEYVPRQESPIPVPNADSSSKNYKENIGTCEQIR